MLVQNLSAVTGACLLVRKSVFDEVNGLDDKLAIAFNDVDFCLKVRQAGYRNLWTPYAELYHHESVSRGATNTRKKRRRMRKEVDYMHQRWGKALYTDPAYNPNLTLIHTDFSPKQYRNTNA
jgi:GT2 family glycosyltransferase